MEFTAKLIQLLPLQTGTGKNGPWKKQEIVVETQEKFPKKICVSIWGDKIDEKLLRPGNALTISFDVESREFNGKWYTDVKAWKIEMAGGKTPVEVENKMPEHESIPDNISYEPKETDDLPF